MWWILLDLSLKNLIFVSLFWLDIKFLSTLLKLFHMRIIVRQLVHIIDLFYFLFYFFMEKILLLFFTFFIFFFLFSFLLIYPIIFQMLWHDNLFLVLLHCFICNRQNWPLLSCFIPKSKKIFSTFFRIIYQWEYCIRS